MSNDKTRGSAMNRTYRRELKTLIPKQIVRVSDTRFSYESPDGTGFVDFPDTTQADKHACRAVRRGVAVVERNHAEKLAEALRHILDLDATVTEGILGELLRPEARAVLAAYEKDLKGGA